MSAGDPDSVSDTDSVLLPPDMQNQTSLFLYIILFIDCDEDPGDYNASAPQPIV